MLWVYAANDKFFGPKLARRLYGAFTDAGGRAQFIGCSEHSAPTATPCSRQPARSIWTPMVDGFLREQHLGRRDLLPAPTPAALPPPPQLSEKGRAGFAAYLAAGPHKVFAVSRQGGYAYRTGLRTAAEALSATLEACAKLARDCAPYAIDDGLVKKDSGPR